MITAMPNRIGATMWLCNRENSTTDSIDSTAITEAIMHTAITAMSLLIGFISSLLSYALLTL